jgi:thiopurine S-methyltransferase
MEKEFWLDRWQEHKIGFHREDYNPQLVKYLSKLSLKQGDTIFVPLCGKTLDMVYALEQGYKVIGVELSSIAVKEFFAENNIAFERTKNEDFDIYRGLDKDITLYCGDLFQLTDIVFDAIYDRASVIALPPQMRERYFNYMMQVTPSQTPTLMITLEYDQSKIDGPPFSVTQNELTEKMDVNYQLELLETQELEPMPRFQEAGLSVVYQKTYLHIKN